MTYNYAALRDNTAYRMLNKFGQSVVVRKVLNNVYDTDEAELSTQYADYTTVGMRLDRKVRTQEGTLKSAKTAYVSAKNVSDDIGVGDLLFFGSEEEPEKITEVLDKIAPGGVTVFYELLLEA